MLQIAIIEDEADLAQQTKDNVVRYLNEHGLEGNIAVFNDGMDIADNYKPIWDIIKHYNVNPLHQHRNWYREIFSSKYLTISECAASLLIEVSKEALVVKK